MSVIVLQCIDLNNILNFNKNKKYLYFYMISITIEEENLIKSTTSASINQKNISVGFLDHIRNDKDARKLTILLMYILLKILILY